MATRNIKTVYHVRGESPKVTRSMDANRAVAQCILHMQINHYGSHIAEVYDDTTGELHAQVKRIVNGNIHIVYMRNPRDYEVKYAASFLIVK